MSDSPILTDVIGNALLNFTVSARTYYIRQPSPEEYDDAMSLQAFTYRKTLAQPHVKDVADMPCSDGERELFERMITDSQTRFDAADPEADAALKASLAEEIASLQNQLEGRTLAQETASDRAALARDRWLCMRLLCDANGKSVFDTSSKSLATAWAKLSMKVKDEARPTIWRVLAMVREVPFESAS
jgi:hypothetical protein